MKTIDITNQPCKCPYCSSTKIKTIQFIDTNGKFVLCKNCNEVFYAYYNSKSCVNCSNLSINNSNDFKYTCKWYNISMNDFQLNKAGTICKNFNKEIPELKENSCNKCDHFKNNRCHNFMIFGYDGKNGGCSDYTSEEKLI